MRGGSPEPVDAGASLQSPVSSPPLPSHRGTCPILASSSVCVARRPTRRILPHGQPLSFVAFLTMITARCTLVIWGGNECRKTEFCMELCTVCVQCSTSAVYTSSCCRRPIMSTNETKFPNSTSSSPTVFAHLVLSLSRCSLCRKLVASSRVLFSHFPCKTMESVNLDDFGNRCSGERARHLPRHPFII